MSTPLNKAHFDIIDRDIGRIQDELASVRRLLVEARERLDEPKVLLVQVTDFNTLRADDVVYDKACLRCGKAWCRTKLTKRDQDGDWMAEDCRPKPGKYGVVNPRAVGQGRVFLVVGP